MKHMHRGGCHCGNISITFETDKSPDELPVRRCTCSFCTKHGAFHTSDPRGRVTFTIRDADRVNRYRFGLATADFLICRNCAVYLAPVFEDGGETFTVVNVNTLDNAADWPAPEPKSFDGEDIIVRHRRRRATWTPVARVG